MVRLRKLRWQLMLTYIPLIFVPVLLVSFVTRGAAEQGLTVLVTQGARQHAHMLSQCFVAYYETHGSWNGLSLKAPGTRLYWGPHINNPPGADMTVAIVRSPIYDFSMNCHMFPSYSEWKF